MPRVGIAGYSSSLRLALHATEHTTHTVQLPFLGLFAYPRSLCRPRRVKLGFGVCLVTERDPIMTAKQIASLDRISNGRVIFGAGVGWNREEMENHGTNFTARWRILRERILAMQTIWREDEPSFHGE